MGKLTLLPPPCAPAMPTTYQTVQVPVEVLPHYRADVLGSTYLPPMQVTLPSPAMPPPVDPLDVHMAWSCRLGGEVEERQGRPLRQVAMDRTTIFSKVWDRIEIAEWIECFAHGHVFAQPSYNGWLLTFVHESDAERFRVWWNAKTITYVPLHIASARVAERIDDWLNTHVAPENMRKSHPTHEGVIHTAFRRDEDRVHFMLRWLGGQDELEDDMG